MPGHDSGLFSWVVRSRDSTTTLHLQGELDLTGAQSSKDALVEELSRAEATVVVDATRLDFIDSTGLRLLLDLKSRLEDAHRSFVIGPTSPQVARVLDVSGIRHLFEADRSDRSAR